MKRIALAALFFFVIPATLASAKTYPSKAGGVSITVPDKGWKVKTGGDEIEISSADESAHMFFGVLDAKDMEKAMKELESEVGKAVKKLKLGKGKESKLNGMDAYYLEGTGTVQDHKVDLMVIIVKTPTGKFVMGFGMGIVGKYEAHEKALAGIVGSIKPL